MYGINMLLSLNKSLSVKLRFILSSLKQTQRNVSQSKTSYDIKSLVGKDVVLYNYENKKLFHCLNIFSLIQCASWSYSGMFLYRLMNDSNDESASRTILGKISEDQRKFGSILSLVTVFFGWSFLIICWSYSFRSIRKLILHKGGKQVTIITYGLPKFNTITAPLTNISSFQHRAKVKKYIPLKVKDKYFYYLLDVRGEFPNPNLFDFTAGLKRTF